MSAIQQAIQHLVADKSLSSELAGRVAVEILEGEATPAQIGAFLVALRIRGETAEHLGAFVRAMRQYATPVVLPAYADLIDTCGTGGDASGTFNISTAAAIVAAGAGARIAKHGNRAVTSAAGSGSADVLAELGVKIDCPAEVSVKCLEACGLGFFFAPAYHGAMRHAGAARREIGVRSILNLLGPLANPAGTKRQIIGVGVPGLTDTFARVLAELGAEHVMVVHGSDGMDEITLTGTTQVSEFRDGKLRNYVIDPQSLGLTLCAPEALRIDAAPDALIATRAAVIREILDGQGGPCRTITELNAAAALVVGGQAEDLRAGLDMSRRAIDSGAARRVLQTLVDVSNGAAAASK